MNGIHLRLGRLIGTLPILLVAAICARFVFPDSARAQLDPFEKVHEKKGPINITAGQVEYDKEHKIVTATGHAKAVQQDFSIEADKLIYYDQEKRLEAVGNVVMQEWENLYKADRMVIDTGNETGILINGEVYLSSGNFQLCGERVEKLPDDRYHIEDGTYTTCTCPPGQKPSWTLRGSSMDVAYGSYGAVSNARLTAKGIPVFYFPKLAFPALRERRSGFLFPDVYWTDRKGFSTSLPFYWAIAKNADATIRPRFMERRGAGADVELRYVMSRRSGGGANFSYFNEFRFKRVAPLDPKRPQRRKLGDQEPAPSVAAFKPDASLHRWELSAGYGHEWTPTLGSNASIHILSDELYWELASRQFDTSKPFTTSTVTTSKGWTGTGLTATVRYFQDLVPTQPPLCRPADGSDLEEASVGVDRARGTCNRIWVVERPITYQQFPRVQFGTSLYDRDQSVLALTLNSEITRFYRFPNVPIPEHLIDQVSAPIEAYRMILTPATGLPYDLWGYFNGSVKLEMDQFVYYVPVYQSGTTQTFTILRPTVEARTSLIRRYTFPFGPIRKIVHQVQPTIRYKLVNPVSLPPRISPQPADATLLEPPPRVEIPPEPGGGMTLHSFGLFGFDGRDGGTKTELIELVLRNQFPTTYVTWSGQEGGIDPFELLLTQPISVNELKRQDIGQSSLTGGYESHYKYNLDPYVRQRQAEQLGLVPVIESDVQKAAPRPEAGDIVSTKDEHRPLLPLLAELRSRVIRNVDIQLLAQVDPYYGREFHTLTAYVGIRDRFRFRRLGLKYTFGARSRKPQNGPDPASANKENPFFFHSQYIEPKARFYLHPRFVIGSDASYDIGWRRLNYGAGSIEYYSACRCWGIFAMAGRRVIGRRENFTLQAVVGPDGLPVLDHEWVFQAGLNLEGLIGLGQRPDY
ncbi:MAG: LPS-assembly protein LptD [Nitrospirae bacterium]|nr:LPS-assembly protein LptD [Nitrospirota bacterium]